MEYLQYIAINHNLGVLDIMGFKPYYKWNTFNTQMEKFIREILEMVLNLIINGIPSILNILK